MTAHPAPDPLAPEAATRLTEFARACKAAARAVTLYPDGHPAIVGALARLVDVAGRAAAGGPLAIGVLPEGLHLDGRVPQRPDAAIGELAALLHGHLIGELRIIGAADPQAWRTFLLLLARPPEEVLAEGGISRLWTATGGTHLQIREIDYAEVLRERESGSEATWDRIIASCLAGDATDLDEETLRALLEIAGNGARLSDLTRRLDEQAGAAGPGASARALILLLRHIARAAASAGPEMLEQVLQNAARAAGQLSPEVMLDLITERYQSSPGSDPDVVGQVVDRMSDATIATFVATSVITERGATARLAQALQALVPDESRRESLIRLAHAELAQTPFGRETRFEELWQRASEMLLSYRDENYVSTDYARELSSARTQALEVEQLAEDPPERVAAWLATVSDAELRRLDLALLLDLLRLEQDDGRWGSLMSPVLAHLDDLVLLGDFESAARLTQALAAEAAGTGTPARRAAAAAALDRLASPEVVGHVVSHLRTIDETGSGHIRSFCHAVGAPAILPLAEALAAEERGRGVRRLTDILVGFGSGGRDAVEQLKSSPNPAVRRTAIYLLRAFGGNEALPELAPLLDDADPNVQREAIRAIATIGTVEAYALLERGLTSGSARAREAVLSALGTLRDERAVPLFLHIVGRREYRRTARGAYETALDGLGAIGGDDAVRGLGQALHQGEWWAPRRTAALRSAAAAALRHVGTPEALAVLREAAETGSRGVRAAAREQLARPAVTRRTAVQEAE